MEDYTTKYLKYLRTTSIKIGLITFYITSFGILGDLFFEYFQQLYNEFTGQNSNEWINPNVVLFLIFFILLNVLTLCFTKKKYDSVLMFIKPISFILGIFSFLIYLLTFHQITTDYSKVSIVKIIYFNLHWIHFILVWVTICLLDFMNKIITDGKNSN
jgi:hypothetical protein